MILHADWGTRARKRWAVRATLRDGTYSASAPHVVDAPTRLLDEAVALAEGGGCALLGFDFAFGAPAAFSIAHEGIHFLSLIAKAEATFFDAALNIDQVGPLRPFLRTASRGDKLSDFLSKIGMTTGSKLRRCEERTGYRPDAKCIFWPGAGQVAGATRSGWRELLRPALSSPARTRGVIRIWPFDGDLNDIVRPGAVVLAETYPAEFYPHLRMRGNAKTNLAWRIAQSGHLLAAARETGIHLDQELVSQIRAGFEERNCGEDRFDATAGLLGMVRAVVGLSPTNAPADAAIREHEGWILGRPTHGPGLEGPTTMAESETIVLT